MKLLDTTVAVDYLRGSEPAVELLEGILAEESEGDGEGASPVGGALVASELVRFELLAGVRKEETAALEDFFTALDWVPVTQDIARIAGGLPHRHRAAFSGIDDVDYLIAATAVVLDAELLTTNVRHFPMLNGLEAAY